MKSILIITVLIFTGNGTGVHTDESVEFNSMSDCQSAKAQLEHDFQSDMSRTSGLDIGKMIPHLFVTCAPNSK